MKFIYENQEENKTLTLNDVGENHFFVCQDGYLCQKIAETAYTTIADDEGYPSCMKFECNYNMPIRRILPRVEKIEF